jgi:putative transposase
MRTAYRCRAYPSEQQQVLLNRTFGCVRVVWNQTLAARRARYAAERRSTSYAETDRALTVLKQDPGLAFLGEVSCVPLQQALRHQHAAFGAFFARRARYPRFKSRRGRQSATFTRSAFRMKGTDLWLAKMSEPLKVVWTWPGTGLAALNPTSVIVARDAADRWFITFHAEVRDPVPLPATGQAAGIDLGLTDFAVLSGGQRISHPRHMDRHEQRLKRHQRRLARCQNGSANRAKAKQKVARAISRTGWAEFRRQLEYKAKRYGRTIVVADRWFPSSKTCSACGFVLAELSLGTRRWACPGCGTRHDRDINTARNILAAGLAAAAPNGGDACGADIRHGQEPPPVQTAANQEPRPARAAIRALHGGE